MVVVMTMMVSRGRDRRGRGRRGRARRGRGHGHGRAPPHSNLFNFRNLGQQRSTLVRQFGFEGLDLAFDFFKGTCNPIGGHNAQRDLSV